MGPRRKIHVAAMEHKKAHQSEDVACCKSSSVMDEEQDTVGEELPVISNSKRSSRPKLVKQSSTEVTAAYHSVRI